MKPCRPQILRKFSEGQAEEDEEEEDLVVVGGGGKEEGSRDKSETIIRGVAKTRYVYFRSRAAGDKHVTFTKVLEPHAKQRYFRVAGKRRYIDNGVGATGNVNVTCYIHVYFLTFHVFEIEIELFAKNQVSRQSQK